MFCSTCGAPINDNSATCKKCGRFVIRHDNSGGSDDEWVIALVLCFSLGFLGAHNFYCGNKNAGIMQLVLSLVSCGLIGGIWSIFDFFSICNETFVKGNGQVLRRS